MNDSSWIKRVIGWFITFIVDLIILERDMGALGSSLKPNQGGKYAGAVGIKEKFRRPLRRDARDQIPEKLKRYTRHDWYVLDYTRLYIYTRLY